MRSHWLDRHLYPEVNANWDDELFRARVLAHLTSSKVLLDLGAGAGIVAQMNFRGVAARVCGIDPDRRVLTNPYLDEGKQALGERIPYESGFFDVVICDNVLEHLANPLQTFSEVYRVLKPGGIFLAKTPNKRHYMPLIARCTPLRFHKFVNRLRGRATEDTFHTWYRANTRRDVKQLAERVGFSIERVETIESRPEYLRMLAVTYVIGFLYERVVNHFRFLEDFRVVLIAELRKDAPTLGDRP